MLTSKQSCSKKTNKHRLQLLKQQFARVRDFNLRQCVRTFTVLAPAGKTDKSALGAHFHGKLIARNHQTLHQQHRRAISDQTIALHLPQSKTTFRMIKMRLKTSSKMSTFSGSSFCWLPSQNCSKFTFL